MVDSKPIPHRHHPILACMMRSLKERAKRAMRSSSSYREESSEMMGYVSKTSFASSQNKVFGRHKELKKLLAIFEHVSSNNSLSSNSRQLALVHGKSGVGKSALLRAFFRSLPKKAICVNAKFDQLKTYAPYAALIKAANDLSRQVMNRQDSNYFLDRIQDELGPDLDLLGSILEALSSLAKKKTQIKTIGQAFTRFKLLMRGLFRSVATPESPVVLFFDDLQWADLATMEVLQSLLTDKQSACVFFIFSYRPDEMDQQVLDEYIFNNTCNASGRDTSCHLHIETTNICVNNLDLTSLNQMVATALNLKLELTLPLSKMIIKKTQGNPFYTYNFMDKLHVDGMLSKTDGNVWTWDVTTILQQTNVADNLADILKSKVSRLPERVRSILQLASFIGHNFPANILATIVHEEQDMIEGEYSFDLFDKKVIEEWIVKALDLALKEGLLEESEGESTFKFSHDKIQQCLYEDLMPDDIERRLLHQRIGKLIWNTIASQECDAVDDWILFLAADNLNRGPKFVDNDGDRVEMVELNLRAGKLAASKAAFLVGVEYLRCGEKLITDDSFVDSNYNLCMDLWCAAADMERIVGEFGRSSELVKKIHSYARKTEDEFPAYSTEIRSLATQGRLTETMELSFKVLKRVGVKFPKSITPLTVVRELLRTKLMIGRRTPEDLMKLPLLTDRKKLFALELLSSISGYSFVVGESAKFIFVAVSLRIMTLTLQYGLSDLYAPQAFVGYGTVCCLLGQVDLGISFGDATLRLLERFDTQSIEPRTQAHYLSFIRPWRHGIDEALGESLLQVYHKGMLVGDVDFAFNGSNGWLYCGFNGTVPLDELVKKGARFRLEMEEYRQESLLLLMIPTLQAARILLGDESNRNPAILTGQEITDLQEFTTKVTETKSSALFCSLVVREVTVAIYFGDWERVRMKMPTVEQIAAAAEGYFIHPTNLILVVWSSYRLYDTTRKKHYLKVGRRYHRQLEQYAKKENPLAMTFCKVLTAAYTAFVEKKPVDECEELFESTLQDLEETKNYCVFSCVADGLIELFLREKNTEKGKKYLQESLECNARWGAQKRVQYLEKKLSLLERGHETRARERTGRVH